MKPTSAHPTNERRGTVGRSLRRLVGRLSRQWMPAWIRDDNGEVFPAKYIERHGRIIVKTHIGRMLEGYADSTTSRPQIAAWWPDSSNMEGSRADE
jgi:hypothetical protein